MTHRRSSVASSFAGEGGYEMDGQSMGMFDLNQVFKIALLGDSEVGKSAIACRFIYKKFNR